MFTKLPKDIIQLSGLELNPKSLYELDILNKRLHRVLDKYFWMNLCIRDFKLNTDEHYAYYYKPDSMPWKEFYRLGSVDVNKLLFDSAKNGDLEFIRVSLNRGADINMIFTNINDEYIYDTPLIISIKQGNLNIVKFLVENNADIQNDCCTLLRLACNLGHLNIVKYLVDKGINIHSYDDTALTYACDGENLEIVKYLVGLKANIQSRENGPLISACYSGHMEIVKYLIGLGADIRAQENEPMKIACNNGNRELIEYLINSGINIQNLDDETLLEICHNERIDVIRDLLELANNRPSIPQPDPLNFGQNIPNNLLKWLDKNDQLTDIQKNLSKRLISERDAFGKRKYGQSLMSDDGRDSIEDSRQEMGDLLQYIFKAKINNEDLSELRQLLPVLETLLS